MYSPLVSACSAFASVSVPASASALLFASVSKLASAYLFNFDRSFLLSFFFFFFFFLFLQTFGLHSSLSPWQNHLKLGWKVACV
jgi:hypothetical protein